jgi:hypothetical protein
MLKTKSPWRLWAYCTGLKAHIRSHTAHNLPILEGEVPETLMTAGSTADISQLVEFGWYYWVFFWDTSISYPDNKEILRRYLGPAPDIGPAMAARILKENGEVVVHSTLRPLPEEILRESDIKERTRFDEAIYARWGPTAKPGDFEEDLDIETPIYEKYEDDAETEAHTVLEADEHEDPDKYDKYLGAEVTLPRGDITTPGRVVSRKSDHEGTPKGRSNSNPLLDTCSYYVEFPDGTKAEYASNIIAERSIYAQADIDGNQYLLLNKIIDPKSDGNAIHADDSHFTTPTVREKICRTTKSWKLCVKWKDESTTWEDLKDLKKSNPVQVAEYMR